MIADLKPYTAYKESGVPWLGEVPEIWEVRQARHIGRLFKGVGGTKEDIVPEGVPCVRYGELYTTHTYFIRASKACIRADRAAGYTLIQYGDVLLAASGETIEEIGKSAVNLMQTAAVCGGDVIVLRPSIPVHAPFLGYAMDCRPAANQKATMGRGTTVKHIYPGELRSLLIPLPTLDEQAAIARFLDWANGRVERAIRAKRKVIALIGELRQCVTEDAFCLPGTKSVRLGVAAELVERAIDRHRQQVYTPIGLFNRGRGIFHKEPTKGAELGDSKFFWIEESDLVLSGQFAWEGAIALASSQDTGCVASHRYPILRGRPEFVASAVLLAFFKTQFGALLLDQHSRGAAGRNRPLNASSLLKEKIPIPPLSAQQRIIELVLLEARLADSVRRIIQAVREFRTRLIADVVTGKLDVRVAAASLPKEADELETHDDADAEGDIDSAEGNLDVPPEEAEV